jgi:type VI secretion system secreted protein VgrG
MSTISPLASVAAVEGSRSRVPIHLELDDTTLTFVVDSCTLDQQLSDEFVFELVVKLAHPVQSVASVIGLAVRVVLEEEPTVPPIHAVCTRLRHLSSDFEWSYFAMRLEPRTCFLRLRRNSRIFKDLDAAQIATAIIEPVAPYVGDVLVQPTQELPVHAYRVQYEESDWDAMRRLLAEDGVAFFYDLEKQTSLHLVTRTARVAAGVRRLPYLPGASLVVGGEPIVIRVAEVLEQTIEGVTVRDAWTERPDFEARGVANVGVEAPRLAQYFFDPHVENTEAELDRQARLRFYEKAMPAHAVEVETNAFLHAGVALEIERAPVPLAEGPLLVLRVHSEWRAGPGQMITRHVATCIPKDRHWFPARLPRLKIPGIQRASVVGDGEIDVDELGRVLCRFRWDRDAVVSRRVEVSQAWAGPRHGHMSHPRVGHEVLVAYLDGDPDEPIVVGRVHDGKNRPERDLPAEKNVSSWRGISTPGGQGYQHIGFDDSAGAELMFLRAQKDLTAEVLNDATVSVGRDFSLAVARNNNIVVTELTRMQMVGNTAWEAVNLSITSIGTLRITSTGDYVLHVGADHSVTIGGYEVRQVDGPYVLSSPTSITLVVEGTSIVMEPGKLALTVDGTSIVLSAGAITQIANLISLNP